MEDVAEKKEFNLALTTAIWGTRVSHLF